MLTRMFERRESPLAPRRVFVVRVAAALLLALVLSFLGLGVGVLGYRYIAGFGWVDSILNASMILGGMGPVGELQSDSAKLFASFYALFSGLVFITITGIVLAPVAHRVLHHFHLDEGGGSEP